MGSPSITVLMVPPSIIVLMVPPSLIVLMVPPSPIVLMVSVDVKQHLQKKKAFVQNSGAV